MATAVIEYQSWRELWNAACTARAGGRTSLAIGLAESVVAAHPDSAEPYVEIANFFAELHSNLSGLDRLYQKHRAEFGLAPDDLTWRPASFPLTRTWLSQVTSLLRTACSAAPEDVAYQHNLADALERLGEAQEAIERREHIGWLSPGFRENHRALLRLLEHTGNGARASRFCETLLALSPAAPETLVAQVRIHDRLGHTEIAQMHYDRLRARVYAKTNSDDQIDFLFRLIWAAARDGLPARSPLARDVRLRCAAMAEGNFSDAKARLAYGYACLIDGDIERAKSSFAIASWIVSHADEQPIDSGSGSIHATDRALRYARAFILDLAPPIASRDEPPNLSSTELALVHSCCLYKSGRLIDALTELARWLAAVPDVIVSRMYKGHHIALRNGIYFGIPLSPKERFTIIGGRAYRVTPLMLFMATLVPDRFRALIHRVTTAAASTETRKVRILEAMVRALVTRRSIKRLVMGIARPLLLRQSISDTLYAPNIYKLFAEIDKRLTKDDGIGDRSAAK